MDREFPEDKGCSTQRQRDPPTYLPQLRRFFGRRFAAIPAPDDRLGQIGLPVITHRPFRLIGFTGDLLRTH
jgi:hypothetical protein